VGYESVKHLEVLQAPMTAGHLDSSRHPGRDDSGAKDVLTKERQGLLLSPGISLKWFAAMPTKEKERERETELQKDKVALLRARGFAILSNLCRGQISKTFSTFVSDILLEALAGPTELFVWVGHCQRPSILHLLEGWFC